MDNQESIMDREGLSTRFRILIADLQHVLFRSCDGLDAEIEVVTIEEGGRLAPPRTARGQQRPSRLTFSHGLVSPETSQSSQKTIFDWFQEVCDPSKTLTKRTISISVENEDGKNIASWKVLNAWPCRWMGPVLSARSNSLTIEQIGFAHEGIVLE